MTTRPDPDQMLFTATQIFTSLLKRGHTIFTTIIAYLPDGSHTHLVTPFDAVEGEIGKQIKIAYVRKCLKDQRAVGYIVGTEAWMSPPRLAPPGVETMADKMRHAASLPRPSEDPDRVDGLLVAAVTRAAVRGSVFEIVRDARGRCERLKPLYVPDDGVWDGRMLDLLDD